MKARLRRFARGLRRRLSNLAWGLGGGSVLALIVASFVRQKLPLERLPDLLAVGVSVAVAFSLLTTTVAFGLALFLRQAREVRASADSTGVHVTRGERTVSHGYDELGAVLRHEARVWVLLRNGNTMELAFDGVEDAKTFERTVQGQIGAGRIELVPHPTLASAPFVLVAILTTCAMTLFLAIDILHEPHFFVPAMLLGTGILVGARLGKALRGKNFVLGHDGIRLGAKFFPFDQIETAYIAKGRVTIVDVDGKSVSGKVHMPVELAEALNAELAARLKVDGAAEEVPKREADEAVHAWLERVRQSIHETSFRSPAMQKERVRGAAFHPKSPFRVRVAALAGFMEEDPQLAEELIAVSADPRLKKAAKAAQGSPDGWRRAVDRLEREGALE